VTNWTEDGSAPDKCDWPHDPCDLPRPWTGGVPKGDPETDEVDPPKPGECEDFPHEYCYVEGSPGDEGESDPGSGESGWVEQDGSLDDPDFTVCIYDLAPPTTEKGKTRAEIRKERAQARRKAARQRAQARRKAARKRAAIKRQKMKAKAKKAAKGRNS
jgi:hypothetical protein